MVRWRSVGACVLTLASLLALGATPTSQSGTSAGGTNQTAVDGDGDGVADDLQALLAEARPNDRFDVIATFHDRASQEAAERGLKAAELRRGFEVVHGFSGTLSAARIDALTRHAGLRRVELNGTMQALMDGARRDFGVELAQQRFGADGTGIGVCIADTGVDPGHEQFDSKVPIPFFDAINGQTTVYDDHGHGTHVASIAVGDGTGGSLAAQFGGVAPAADLYVAKILDSGGSGNDDQVIAGIEWCAQQVGVRVINLSIGDPTILDSDGTDAVSQAVDNAVSTYGKVVAAAAGNSGDMPTTINPPGVAALALTVGAGAEWSAPAGTNRDSRGIYLAPFSSRGPTVDDRMKPDIVAPGHTIVAAAQGTTQTYTGKSGTSMATPFAAGVAALVLDVRPDLSPTRVKLLLENTARDRGAPGTDIDWGSGLVDAYEVTRLLADIRHYDHHTFPMENYVEGTVADGSTWSLEYEVPPEAVGAPLAVTMLIEGTPNCVFLWIDGCLIYEWAPDLDLELYDQVGNLLAYSYCASGASHGGCANGRQETIGYRVGAAGTYLLKVLTVSDSQSDGTGGNFSLSIQHQAPAPPMRGLFGNDSSDGGTETQTESSMAGQALLDGRTWTASVDVEVVGVDSGVVFGTWAHDGQVGWCSLDDGSCSVERPALTNSLDEVTFTVTEVATGTATGVTLDGSETVTIYR